MGGWRDTVFMDLPPPNGSAVKLPAQKCTRRTVWSMTCFEDPPATHIYRPAEAPVSFKRRLGGTLCTPMLEASPHKLADVSSRPLFELGLQALCCKGCVCKCVRSERDEALKLRWITKGHAIAPLGAQFF